MSTGEDPRQNVARPLLSLLALAALLVVVWWRPGPIPEGAPIGALKTLGTSQVIFREGDRDGDKIRDYGSLAELSAASLIDEVLGSGTKQGYVFEVRVGEDPLTQWAAVARPLKPGESGTRYFVTNQEGVIYFTTAGPFQVNAACEIPAGAAPVGE